MDHSQGCVICGEQWRSRYFNQLQPICYEHWHAMPIKLKKEWWLDIDYGKRAPSPEMVQRLKGYFNGKDN